MPGPGMVGLCAPPPIAGDGAHRRRAARTRPLMASKTPHSTSPVKIMSVPGSINLVNVSRGTTIADRVEIATSLWARGKGVMGRRNLPVGFGLVIKPCNSIHTFAVFTALDVLFVGRDGRILKLLSPIRPWRVGPIVWRSAWVAELPPGTVVATGTQVGDVVALLAQEDDSAASGA